MIYVFEDFRLDPDRRELHQGGKIVAMEPQVFDLLQCLVRDRDRVLTRDDLIARVWNGRIVSDSTLGSRIAAVRQALGDRGEEQRLVRTFARKGFRFVGDVREESPSPPVDPSAGAAPHADRPSIAVLPLANLSSDAGQDYFVEGVTDEIITALSRFRWLQVIARSSSFAFRDRSADAKQVGARLGVRYVLEGSVRKSAGGVRLNAQLIDTRTSTHLWAQRFEGRLEDVFELQDQIAARVAGAIAPQLEQAEIDRARRKPAASLDAYDYYLRGLGNVYQWTRSSIDDALRLFREAMHLDPEFAPAYAMAAYCYVQRRSNGWTSDRAQDRQEADRLARRAAELGNEDASSLCKAAHALSYVAGDVEGGAELIGRALSLNPTLAAAWYVSGWIRVFLGEHAKALAEHSRAAELSPFDPLIYHVHAGIGYAHCFEGRCDEAAEWCGRALHMRPDYLTALRGAAMSHALAGRLEEARRMMARMRALDPALRLSTLEGFMPLRRKEDFERWSEGLRLAGLLK